MKEKELRARKKEQTSTWEIKRKEKQERK